MEVMKMQAGGGDGREIRGRQEEGTEGEGKPRATSQRIFTPLALHLLRGSRKGGCSHI